MENMKKNIGEYAAAGYHLTPLRGKVPVKKGWQKTPYEPLPAPEDFPGNFGVVLQDDDLVIDADPRNYKDGKNSLQELCRNIGWSIRQSGAFAVKTGGGGWHIYLKKPKNVHIIGGLHEYPGVEYKTKGAQVVGAGCVHPETKRTYDCLSGNVHACVAAPQSLLSLITQDHATLPERTAGDNVGPVDAENARARFCSWLTTAPIAIQGESGDKTTYAVACKAKDFGVSEDTCLHIMLKEYDPKCQPPWGAEELRSKITNAYAYSQNLFASAAPHSDFSVVPTEASPGSAPKPVLRWDVTDNGQRKKTLNNCVNYFLRIPTGSGSTDGQNPLRDILAWDEFTGQVMFVKRAPWHAASRIIPADGTPWSDEEITMCRYWLSKVESYDVTAAVVAEAMLVVAKKNTNHPVRNFLRGIVWDKKPRLDTWLVDYCAVEDSQYTRDVGSKTLAGAVARIMRPGCQFDYMLVLEGEQGTYKSSVVAVLGGPWYADVVINPHEKDTVEALRGKWMVEASEMDFTTRAEAQAQKAFISRRVDVIRVAYGRVAQQFPRQCIFIGTTNLEADLGYLKDATGNRRFWPVRTGKIDIDGLRAVREQLFAEAVCRYDAGESLYIRDESTRQQALQEQHNRRQVDPWLDKIAGWLEKDEFGRSRDVVTTMQVWTDCLQGLEKQFSRKEMCRIANVLQLELRWEKTTFRDPDTKQTVRGYKRG